MARFFLPRNKMHDQVGALDGAQLDHLRKVLRVKPGDHITTFDDNGWEHEAVIRSMTSSKAELEVIHSYPVERESPLELMLAVGLTKGEKIDFVIEKATELGVRTIVPFASTYAVPKLDDRKIAARTERWRKIALSATKQSGRTSVPEIWPLLKFDDLLDHASLPAVKLLCWEKETEQSLQRAHNRLRDANAVLVAVGPEGGFSASEADRARQQGFERVHLGRRILRAETAALTALALVQFLWGDMS
jgi:16S rRNA (uracil1498-N3)-methyltransferase